MDIADGHIFHLVNTIVFFAIIPILSTISVVKLFAQTDLRQRYSLLFMIFIDLTVVYALIMISGFTALRNMYPGFYIMSVGVLLLNLIRIMIFFENRKADANNKNL